jgi:ribosomal protein S18 acetylase RimI-like enzyme
VAGDLTIRDARTGDVPRLAELIEQLGYPASVDAVGARVERLSASGAARVVVAELDGDVVGLASVQISQTLEYDEPVARVSALVVDERRRRRGIGEALVAELEAEARRRCCCLIFLTTAERRTEAHSFYRRIGFEETGRRFAMRL